MPIHIYVRRSHRGLEVCEAICRRGRMGADLWQAVWALPSTKINPLEFCTKHFGSTTQGRQLGMIGKQMLQD